MFQTKVVWFAKGHERILLIRLMSSDPGHINFFKWKIVFFIPSNRIADSKGFSKHYNEVYFHYVLLELRDSKVTVFSISIGTLNLLTWVSLPLTSKYFINVSPLTSHVGMLYRAISVIVYVKNELKINALRI